MYVKYITDRSIVYKDQESCLYGEPDEDPYHQGFDEYNYRVKTQDRPSSQESAHYHSDDSGLSDIATPEYHSEESESSKQET